MCPPQLGQLLQGNYESITALDTEVIAISHETVAINKMLSERYETEFPSLSDTSRQTIHAYEAVDRGLNIAQITFFVIDMEGVIRWRSRVHSGANPDDLPPIEDLLDAIALAQ